MESLNFASKVLQHVWAEFINHFDAAANVDLLFPMELIDFPTMNVISNAKSKKAANHAFLSHLMNNATIESLWKLCELLRDTARDHQRHDSLAKLLEDELKQCKVPLSSPVAVQKGGRGEDGPSSSQSTTSELSNKVFSDENAASRLGIVAALDLSKGTSQPIVHTDAYLAKDPPHREVEAAFFRLQSRLASVFNKHCDFAELKLFLRLRQKNDEWPFKELDVEEIDSMKDIRTIFGKICTNWLNTEVFIRLIDVLPDKKSRDDAKQHLEVYHRQLELLEPRKEQDKELPHEDSASNSWVKQYEKVIRERDSVKVDITRCVLIGPARVGKSSLKQLLVHNKPRAVHKSTDLMEAPVVLASMYHQRNKSGWELLTVDNLKQMLKKSIAEGEYDSPSTAAVQELHQSQESGSIQSSGTDHPSKLPSTVPKKDDCLADLKSQFSRFVEGLESVGDTQLIMNGLQLIHLFDCGGQLAFQDAIPCLIHAPCAFIAVFDASVDLEEVKEWTYCPHEGSKEVGRGHRESQWNILSRIFSSIHSLQCKCRDDLKKLIKDKLSSPWPIAVVGTHNDELKQHKDFGTINQSIISHFADVKKSKPYLFLQPEPPDLVENITVPMDDACTQTINRLREQLPKKASFSVDLPLSWLFLELFTRTQHPKLLFISYEDLRKLCNHEKLITEGDEEFESLLRVLHALGFYAFYPLKDLGVPLSLDQNWVCTDAATLYKEVSKLLMVQYTVDKPETEATKCLKDEGKIELNDGSLRELFDELKIGKINDEIDRLFSPRWLILVLVYIGLAAKFKREGIEQVFIPLVLPFKGYDLPPVTELSVATLFLTLEFPSGRSRGSVTPILTDLPCGIFSRLVVLLLSEESECPFEIFAEDSDRTCVKLVPSTSKGGYVLYLKNHPNYVEVALQVKKSASKDHCKVAEKVYERCQSLRQTLTSFLTAAFFKLFGEQPPEKAVTARCGFKCTCKKSVKADHLAVMIMEEQFFFKCVFKNREYFLESENCDSETIWFCPVPAKVSLKDGSDIWVMDNSSSSALGKRSPAKTPSSVSKRQPSVSALEIKPKEKELRKIADNCGHEWNALLTNVGVLNAQIQQFQVNAATTQDACFAGLVFWRDGNAEEPATWSILLEAMEEAKMVAYAREWKKKIIDSCSGQSGSGKPGNGQPPTPAKEVPSDVPKLTNIKDFMEHFKDKFLEDVAVEDVMVDRFKNNNVIPEQVYSKVMKEDTSYGKRSKIWIQVRNQGVYETVEKLCKAMIATENSPKTIKLGKKMEAALIANKAVILKNEE